MRKSRIIILVTVSLAFALGGTLFSAYGQEKAKQTAPAVVKETAGLTVARLVVGTGVENKEPVGVAEKFAASTEKIYCFLEATGIVKDTEVSFVWIYNGKEMLKTNMTLKAGGKWRTNVNKNLHGLKGDWKVELRDAGGNVLKEVTFKAE
jgi:Protein of unknown function (DUF2914)